MKLLITIFAILMWTANAPSASTCGYSTRANQDESESVRQDSDEVGDQLSEAEQLQVAVQKICPVSGKKLGSMGTPVKVRAGEQIAYLCCDGCKEKQLDAAHWQTIQANIALAQGVCPIMGKPVNSTMASTVVNGRQVFVCCPPCVEKIKADIDGAMKRVNDNYETFVAKERQVQSDYLHMIAQGICPVTGEKLGAMGTPVKVRVGDEEIAFLCCKDCVGQQIKAGHWETVQTNLAKAQGICPVMQKPVDASMESTVVNGRRIFVCCTPCIEKIKSDPDNYIAIINAQIVKNRGVDQTHFSGDHENLKQP